MLIQWKGTPGVGDFMMGLNVAHHVSFTKNVNVDLEVHWYHSKEHLHHFEDPETIVDRLEYSHCHYKNKHNVNVSYVFNSTDDKLWAARFRGVQFSPTPYNPINNWIHKQNSFSATKKDKVVIWRPLFNSEIPRSWKMPIDNYTWEMIISLLKAYGFYVEELTYRHTIAEAYYHISNCDFVISYDGMWHYIARNFLKPMTVFSDNRVTQFHTPNAVMVSGRNALQYFNDIDSAISQMDEQLVKYKTMLGNII